MRIARVANALTTAATVTSAVSLGGFIVGLNAGWEAVALVCAWTAVAVAPPLYVAALGAYLVGGLRSKRA